MKKVIIAITLLLTVQCSFGQSAIHVLKTGAGDPIMFLPGFTTPGSVWDETIDNLNGPYERHTVSYAGFNGLEPIGIPWYAPIKTQLIDYIKNEDLSDLTLIGHSMGGNLAIDIAAELPDRIAGLLLVESIPCMREMMMPGVPASNIQYDSPYNQQILNMPDEDFKQMVTGTSQNMTIQQSKIETLVNWSVMADRETYVYGYTDLLKLDLRDKLPNIKVKTLILGAGASYPDKDMVRSNYEKQYANLSAKEILMAENSKHFIMFDQPEWFYGKVNDFLSYNE